MTAENVNKWLKVHFGNSRGAIFTINNVYFFDPKIEDDFLAVTWDRDIIAVETKVSKWDYLQDFKKVRRHEFLSSKSDLSKIPNQFYFCTTKGLIKKDEVPGYAGLYHIESNGRLQVIKQAPRLHNEKIDPKQWESLAIKLYQKS